MLDFSEAQAKIKEDENRRRIEEGLTTGLTKEVSETTWVASFVCRRSIILSSSMQPELV
jgi:hypothetical protein